MTRDTVVYATYEFPQVRRFLDRRGVAYSVAPGSPAGCDMGCDHWIVTFARAEDAQAFRAEHQDLLLPEYGRPVLARVIEEAAAAASAGNGNGKRPLRSGTGVPARRSLIRRDGPARARAG